MSRAVLIVVAVFLVCPSAGGAKRAATVTVRCSLGQCGNFYGWTCDRPVELDSVVVTMDVPAGAKGKARDAIYLGPGCTGRIGSVTVFTNGGDGIKVAEGAHDLTISGGTISCAGTWADVHQDGIQAMGGSRITFRDVVVRCVTANDAQFRVVMAGSSTVPPDRIVCTGCEFHPGPNAWHDVTIGVSTSSGVTGSLVCPSLAPNMVFAATGATSPVNANNTFAASC